MLSDTVQKAINEQIHAEFYSFYLYLSVAGWFTNRHLDGFAHWMQIQAQEEYGHAMKLFRYVHDRGSAVKLQTIDAPQSDWTSPSVAFESVLNHERHISERINTLVNLASSERDHATAAMLQWYVNEQVEEEATADTLFHQVKMLESSPQGLFMLDRELAARPAPAATAAEAE